MKAPIPPIMKLSERLPDQLDIAMAACQSFAVDKQLVERAKKALRAEGVRQ